MINFRHGNDSKNKLHKNILLPKISVQQANCVSIRVLMFSPRWYSMMRSSGLWWTVWYCGRTPTFRRSMLPPSSGWGIEAAWTSYQKKLHGVTTQKTSTSICCCYCCCYYYCSSSSSSSSSSTVKREAFLSTRECLRSRGV